MADIVLRNLDDALKEQLRQRAARNQRSMNAELRDIVRQGLLMPEGPQAGGVTLQSLAADIRALSAAQVQTPSQELLRASRDER